MIRLAEGDYKGGTENTPTFPQVFLTFCTGFPQVFHRPCGKYAL